MRAILYLLGFGAVGLYLLVALVGLRGSSPSRLWRIGGASGACLLAVGAAVVPDQEVLSTALMMIGAALMVVSLTQERRLRKGPGGASG